MQATASTAGARLSSSSAVTRGRPARAAAGVVVRAELKPGARVRVSVPLKVWHVGKFKDGLELQGMEGEVVANVADWKGQVLSATTPWKVQFLAKDPAGGKDVKVLAHVAEEEVEVLP